ncbi:MAG TPA: hypothetical protein VFB66_14885, partial [Tepidisphaeraceae bacterium]|nr:hypothetical protein [Tepidisphaeraceae bacterium]
SPDGTLDPTFGDGGAAVFRFGTIYYELAEAVAVKPDGRIVVAGEATGGFAVARLDAAGRLDTSFSGDGRVVTYPLQPPQLPVGYGPFANATSLALHDDGRITVAGSHAWDFYPSGELAVARYDDDGNLDPTFGDGGKRVYRIRGVGRSIEHPVRVALDSFGRTVLATTTVYPEDLSGDWEFLVTRLTADGRIDTGFAPDHPDGSYNGTGILQLGFASGGRDVLYDLLAVDGKLVLAGSAAPDTGFPAAEVPDFALARLTEAGALDPSFGNGGKVTTDFAGGADAVTAVAVDAAGRLVAAGYATAPGRAADFAAARHFLRGDPRVLGRYLFYNNSFVDGPNPAANGLDDAAIDRTKAALLPGRAPAFANISGYSRGINGVMVDLADRPADWLLTHNDFSFRTGSAEGWSPAPAVPDITIRRGAGVRGSDRITFTWPDGLIRDTWLEVTVKATERTGLASPDVFYFGNLVGNTGGRASPDGAASVDALDLLRTRRAASPQTFITNPHDHNHDGRVTPADFAIARSNLGRRLGAFGATAPAPPTPSVPSRAEDEDAAVRTLLS